jgi:hypothetical protein
MTETTSDVVARIRSRGYWDVTVHPAQRVDTPLPASQLLPTLAQNAVSLRGWPVPSIDPRHEPMYTPESVRQDIDATMVDHLEAWQFTVEYQFSQLRSVSADWRSGSEKTPVPAGASAVIEVWEILFYLTELVELAARLALASKSPRFVIATELHNMRGRALVAGTRGREWHGLHLSSSDDLTADKTLLSEELAARPREVAVELSTTMMAWFGFHPVDGVLRDYQQELISRS